MRNRVYKFYSEHTASGKLFTVLHFLAEGTPRRTTYNILQRYEKGLLPERSTGSGRKPKIMTPKALSRLEKVFQNNDRISIRTAAPKFHSSKSWVHEALVTKTSVRYRSKKKIPDRTDEQKAAARPKCRRLIEKFSDLSFILDDESYFTLGHSAINGNGGYYTFDVSSAPSDLKCVKKKKFESKVLVWIAIGPAGLSQPLIRKSGYAINAQRYLDECIKRRLIPYIRQNYTDDQYVFWPDQASSHYAKIVLDHLRAENINFVNKSDNPANVPEIRVIENFWAYLKSLVYAKGWKAKNVDQLITRIKYCLKRVDQSVVQKLALSTKGRIDAVRRHGLIESQ